MCKLKFNLNNNKHYFIVLKYIIYFIQKVFGNSKLWNPNFGFKAPLVFQTVTSSVDLK